MADFTKWIKQLFCRHDWVAVDGMNRFMNRVDGIPVECLAASYECKKCGKHKSIFIRMPEYFD